MQRKELTIGKKREELYDYCAGVTQPDCNKGNCPLFIYCREGKLIDNFTEREVNQEYEKITNR